MLWSDVDARARGLGTRLVGGARLRGWASAPNLVEVVALALRIGRQATGPEPPVIDPSLVEARMVRLVAGRLRLLQQWAGQRAPRLAALFEEEERGAVRALVRGVVVGIPVSVRLRSIVPTQALPDDVLQSLAAEPTADRLAAALARRRHPYGASLLAAIRRGMTHLLALEHCLDSVFADRVRASAHGADQPLARYARFAIDVQNCWWAIVLAGLPTKEERMAPERWFLPGGWQLSLPAYVRAVGTSSRIAAATMLARAFPRTVLASTLRTGQSIDALQDAALATACAQAHTAALAQPLSTAPVIAYVLRQRAELRDVQRLLWGRALGAPAERLRVEMVSP